MNLKGKNVLIYGYSVSGKSAAALARRYGARVFVYDDKELNGLLTGVTLVSNLRLAATEADIIVISPSVPFDKPELVRARAEGKRVVGELEFAYGFLEGSLVAITGTNGKTTTTLLITEILNLAGQSAQAVGNIGVAFSERVTGISREETAVVEVSSFQLESIDTFSPDVACLLNITPDHLDRHGDFNTYADVKSRIFARQTAADYAVINADDEVAMESSQYAVSEKYYFSKKKRVRGAYVLDGTLYFENGKRKELCDVSDLRLKGEHNLENALAAACVCMLKGVEPDIIKMVLKTFTLPEYRNEYLGCKRGKHFYNDSKGTNVAATLAALKSVTGDTLLIAGGSDKGENFDDLFSTMPKNVVYALVTGGNADKLIESALRCGFYTISYRATLEECVTESLRFNVKNVIFSPSSASFDNYIDYKHRGAVFTGCYDGL